MQKEAKCGQSEHEPDRKAESISLSFPVKPEMRKKAEGQGGYDSSVDYRPKCGTTRFFEKQRLEEGILGKPVAESTYYSSSNVSYES